MAQGAVKKAGKAPNGKKTANASKQLRPQGSRVIKPKKASLIAAQKLKKKSAAGMTAQTEKALAQKAGHLEMLKGGKKDTKGKPAVAVKKA